MSSTFRSLRYYNYRLWFISNVVASTGVWMQRVAQDWLVLTILTDNSGLAVGNVTALQFAPLLLFGPYAGLVADRVNRKTLLYITQGIMGILAVITGILVLTKTAELWQIYLLATAGGIVQAFDSPTRQTFVSALVPTRSMPNAVALNSAAFNLARLIGPAVSGITIAQVGIGWVFLIDAILFLAPVAAMFAMRNALLIPGKQPARKPGQIREALRYVRGRSDIVIIMIVAGIVSAFGLNFQLTSAVMAREVFDKGPGEFGILGSVMAIGSLAGALMAARRNDPRVRNVVLAAFGFGICEAGLALAPNYITFAILAIPTGFFALMMITSATAAVQITSDPSMSGRVMSLYTMVFLGSTPFGSPVVGWVAENCGARWSLGIGAISSILVAVICGIWAKQTWHVRIARRKAAPFFVTFGPRERAERETDGIPEHLVLPEPDPEGEADPQDRS